MEELIWEDGVFIATYDEVGTLYDVYHLYDFYVAFSYSLDKNEVTHITAHANLDELLVKSMISNLQ